jgi:hypothetical protein
MNSNANKSHSSADQLPIECVPWTYSLCDQSQLVDCYTEDGRMVFEQWEAHQAIPHIADHNASLAR